MTHARQLFAPARLGELQLRNRLVRSATWEGMCDPEGVPGDELIALHRALAAGGTGLLITGFAYVAQEGKLLPGALSLKDEAPADAVRRLVDAVHAEGGRICAQIGHAGGQTRSDVCGCTPIAPSAIELEQYPQRPLEMTADDIARVIDAFAAAADRARRWGFDAIQLHAAHGYLINQFLSPLSNRRTDAWGGDPDNRMRFLLEVYAAVRQTVGSRLPLLVKLSLDDHLEGGLCCDDALQVACALDTAGIDGIEISSGTPASGDRTPVRRRRADDPPLQPYNLELAERLRPVVRCPLLLVGGIRDRLRAESILRCGSADFISLCRPFICEPDLARRWQGESLAVAACISCNGCFKTAFRGRLRCVRTDRDAG
ncbi:2,4-dienoyl-CoA reductase-like NADH-dependent reductase (Old Yellow Enzyme family) [Geothermobacter ehrlichii]|uniref:2,4-dienoyl-CoA reductase-like NADH-dependent reductase (Old Yellow Enzyme family) n=1 Tax=Geothermobacter ehrlichii TaxID=213224 RepID=A0A5D3WHB7_9BACT|nr:NADH:flavin oxidoreductase [Geothermobacter ehrlichii]TYO95756.1 2,4-dienoyl-CoA reductase-like NADH-dependent reductase (Old Yellow Enzyme family) [Geothermobacter ehrlichii]